MVNIKDISYKLINTRLTPSEDDKIFHKRERKYNLYSGSVQHVRLVIAFIRSKYLNAPDFTVRLILNVLQYQTVRKK